MTAAEVETRPLFGLAEHHMLDLLRKRYGPHGRMGLTRYVYAQHVRSHAGFDARRTADFIALDTWATKLAWHGHEVKVSRSDWLTELKHPEKAAEFTPYMHYWWAVVPDSSIVRDGELPDGWGLLTIGRGGGLRVAVQAQRRDAQPMPLTRLAALLRAVRKTCGEVSA